MSKENLRRVEMYFNKSFDEIFKENEKYINITISNFYNKYKKTIWKDDIKQCAMIGLANAIETLDLDRVDSFTNHIITCIRREVLYFENELFGAKGFSRREAYDEGIDSLDEKTNRKDSDSKDTFVIDTIASLSDMENDVTKGIDLYSAINSLNEDDRLIVEWLLDGKKQKVIAKTLGISEATVTQRLKKIYKKLNKCLTLNV